MKLCPGIINNICEDVTWIRPRRGGLVKGPPIRKDVSIEIGDNVMYTISGNGLHVMDIFLPGGQTQLNPRPENEEVCDATWGFEKRGWVTPIWATWVV